ncbi:MAG: T9SS type A sorting domain-containing protein [Bacteroidia bacterium]
MKKILLTATTFLGISAGGFCQLSLQTTSGATISNGDTIIVTGTVGFQLSDEFYIFDSALPLSATIFCAPTSVAVHGCTYSVCVGSTCYPPKADNTNWTSPSFKVPAGKDSANGLFTDYNADSAGITIIRYDIRNSTLADSAWIFVEFNATPTGIPTISSNDLHFSALYPNPANSVVNFTYHTDYDAQLGIYNSLGQLVKTMSLASFKEKASLNTSDLPSGLYICKMQADGATPAFRRLVISH